MPSDADGSGRRRARLAIVRRELASLRSEKTIVLALLIQLFVAAFSSFLVVGLVSLYDPGAVDEGGVRVGVTGNASGDVVAAVDRADGLTARRYRTAGAAVEGFRARQIDLVLEARRAGAGRIDVLATAPAESVRTTLVVVRLREALEDLERTKRLEYRGEYDSRLLALPSEADASPYFGFTYTVLIPLLMFLPVFISGSVAVDSVTEEVQRGTLELLRVAPLSLADVLDAKLLAAGVLAPVQAALWLALLSFNGIAVSHPVAVVALVAAFSLAVTAVGVGIALVARERQQAQLLYSSGVLLALGTATLLPEHPANAVAKLAIDSPTGATWAALAGYLALGAAAYGVVRAGVARIDPEGL